MPSNTYKAPGNPGMPPLSFRTEEGAKAFEAFATNPAQAVVMLDGDGTMWDVVMFPAMPSIDRRYAGVLRTLIERTGVTGLLTGRSVGQIRDFGLLVDKIHVVGQFGCEAYHDGRLTEWVERPEGLVTFDRWLLPLLNEIGMADLVSIEDVKSHFRAVHYPDGTDPKVVRRLLAHLKRLADDTGLAFLPGNKVVEMGPMVSKEISLRRFVSELPWPPSVVLYAGDSTPDLAAFAELDRLRHVLGVPTVKVCTSDNPDVLEQADLVVSGPQGTLTMLDRLCEITAG